jgi:hypothetical protein
VTKQFSKLSTESAQQLAQLDGASEGELNELLDRLEAEKSRLPKEDHPILEWGISVTRIKMLEQEAFENKMSAELESKFSDYNHFFTHYEDRIDNSLQFIPDILDEIARESSPYNPSAAQSVARNFGKHVQRLCRESKLKDEPQYILSKCSAFCNNRISQIGVGNPTLKSSYEMILKGLKTV